MLLAEANAGGVTRVTIVSARRTNAEQISLRRAHCGSSEYDVWKKPSGECSPPTAVPGASKHETGDAVDFGGDLTLVGQLAPKCGLRRTVAGEPWHYEAVQDDGIFPGGGDSSFGITDVPGAVVDVGKDAADFITDPLEAIAGFFRLLLKGSTWMRVASVVGGLALLGLGLALIIGDSKTGRTVIGAGAGAKTGGAAGAVTGARALAKEGGDDVGDPETPDVNPEPDAVKR